jgi:hypothetical protein
MEGRELEDAERRETQRRNEEERHYASRIASSSARL